MRHNGHELLLVVELFDFMTKLVDPKQVEINRDTGGSHRPPAGEDASFSMEAPVSLPAAANSPGVQE